MSDEPKKLSFWQKCVSPMVLWNVGGMIVFILVVLIGTWVWMGRYTNHGVSVRVPDVEGMGVEYACQRLQQDGLSGVVIDSTYNEKVPPGEVMDQNPKAGSRVKQGREIGLIVNSLSAPALPLPDVAGNSGRHQAEMRLKAMGFKVTEPVLTRGDKDWVYEMRVGSRAVLNGQRVRLDQPITLVVGDGSTDPDYTPEQAQDDGDAVIDEIINDLF